MKIPCQKIAHQLRTHLVERVEFLKKRGAIPHLATVLVGNRVEQRSFVKIKRRVAEELGIEFSFFEFDPAPSFNTFLSRIQTITGDKSVTGIIIQHPLPSSYSQDTLYKHIPLNKEIEGFRENSQFHFPLIHAVFSGLKYVILQEQQYVNSTYLTNLRDDKEFFYTYLKTKKIVVAGRGSTGGKPIANYLDELSVSYEVTHSQRVNPLIYKDADVIFTAVGEKILTPDLLKKGVVLLNVGLRKEGKQLRGDYDEDEVKDIASYFTQTPNGLGPLDVLYLYNNLVSATEMNSGN